MKTRKFADAVARVLQEELERRGVNVPVLGEVSDAFADVERVVVLCVSAEEQIPGNSSYQLELEVQLYVPATGATSADTEARLDELAGGVRAAWKVLAECQTLDDYGCGCDLYQVREVIGPLEASGSHYQATYQLTVWAQF